MARFQLRGGPHFDKDGNMLSNGAVVESTEDLTKGPFGDKFVRLTKDEPETEDEIRNRMAEDQKKLDELEAKRKADEAAANSEEAKKKSKPAKDEKIKKIVKDEKGKETKEDFVTDEDDDDDEDENEDEGESRQQKKSQKLGNDVTHKFPNAKKKGLTVHFDEDESEYTIAKKGKIVEGGEAMSRGKVKSFITKYKD